MYGAESPITQEAAVLFESGGFLCFAPVFHEAKYLVYAILTFRMGALTIFK
jgi:hypothetical protein